MLKAKALVDIAAKAGLDSVKFQIINPWGLYLPGEYSYGHYDIKDVIAIREKGVMRDDEYEEVARHASAQGIPFTASVFDTAGLDLLCSFDPPYIKTASCDLNNVRFLAEVAERGKPMVVSTGMSTLKDIERSVKVISNQGLEEIVLLHCVSIYPCPLEKTNLPFLTTLKESFGYDIGFSDHTAGSQAACMALAMGATWFEKHFTEDASQEGFDHAYAMEPDGLQTYREDLHAARIALNTDEDKLSDAERYTRNRARRSLYAKHDLKSGHVISADDVLIVRPEGPMDADRYPELLGARLSQDMVQHQAFEEHLLVK